MSTPEPNNLTFDDAGCPSRNITFNKIQSPDELLIGINRQLSSNFCAYMTRSIAFINRLRTKIYKLLHTTETSLNSTFPESSAYSKLAHVNSRSQRSLSAIVGSISAATTVISGLNLAETARLRSHLKFAHSRIDKMRANQISSHKKLSSYAKLTSKTISSLHKGFNNSAHIFRHIMSNQRTDTHLKNEEHLILYNVLMDLESRIELSQKLSTLRTAFNQILTGTLSPDIIAFSEVEKAIAHINTKLSERKSRLRVPKLLISDFYRLKDFSFQRINNILYINVQLPLINEAYSATLYKVISFELPINASSQHTTSLHLSMPRFVAITNDINYITYIYDDAIVHDKFFENAPLINADNSCLFAIHADQRKKIAQLCVYNINLNALQPFVLHIAQNVYVVSSIANYLIHCNDSVQQLPTCGAINSHTCVREFRCECTIELAKFLIVPTANCMQTTQSDPLFIINLPILEIFYGADVAVNQPSNATIKDPITMELYDQESFDRNFEKLTTESLSLADFAERINTTSPEIWAHYVKRNPFDIITILMLPTLAFIGAILFVIHYRASKALAIALLLQDSIKPADGLDFVKSYVDTMYEAPNSNVPTAFWLAFFTALLIPFITMAYERMKWTFFNNTLYLEFCSSKFCALVPVAKYQNCALFNHLTAIQNMSDFAITGKWWNQKLTYNINDLRIQDMRTTLFHHIPEVVTLSFSNAYTLRKILNNKLIEPITINILFSHHKRVFLKAHVCPTNCTRCFTRVFPIKSSMDIIA